MSSRSVAWNVSAAGSLKLGIVCVFVMQYLAINVNGVS